MIAKNTHTAPRARGNVVRVGTAPKFPLVLGTYKNFAFCAGTMAANRANRPPGKAAGTTHSRSTKHSRAHTLQMGISSSLSADMRGSPTETLELWLLKIAAAGVW